ncbi:MAG: hypothetical protein GWM98_11020 [Nitrospinaceae bacterium]|nr:hypothetical protein [Nitrospinaceae bacterium]NIR54928.1 hypothetical protein [Nitrospinaceae bacterium]NIS85356.1 hypothetical protein [Nitrospinaceae bacterium]NIT82170.1 hypothetical protein [Nitrospinaceae bacterium]NIW06018.1 hypothetical protein [Nitrospinaceae bacterium]
MWLIVLFALPIFSGCSSIHIHNGKDVKKEWGFGITRLTVTPGNRPVTINTQGVGLVNGYSSTTLGWLKEGVVVIPNPEECHAIFINQTEEQTREIQKILQEGHASLENLCFSP